MSNGTTRDVDVSPCFIAPSIRIHIGVDEPCEIMLVYTALTQTDPLRTVCDHVRSSSQQHVSHSHQPSEIVTLQPQHRLRANADQ